jgi:hypothetical protein
MKRAEWAVLVGTLLHVGAAVWFLNGQGPSHTKVEHVRSPGATSVEPEGFLWRNDNSGPRRVAKSRQPKNNLEGPMRQRLVGRSEKPHDANEPLPNQATEFESDTMDPDLDGVSPEGYERRALPLGVAYAPEFAPPERERNADKSRHHAKDPANLRGSLKAADVAKGYVKGTFLARAVERAANVHGGLLPTGEARFSFEVDQNASAKLISVGQTDARFASIAPHVENEVNNPAMVSGLHVVVLLRVWLQGESGPSSKDGAHVFVRADGEMVSTPNVTSRAPGCVGETQHIVGDNAGIHRNHSW